jgi:hypothetical protein
LCLVLRAGAPPPQDHSSASPSSTGWSVNALIIRWLRTGAPTVSSSAASAAWSAWSMASLPLASSLRRDGGWMT